MFSLSLSLFVPLRMHVTDTQRAVEKPTDKAPLWQSALSALPKPDYSPTVSPEWEYLRALGRSSLLDVAVYDQFRSTGTLAAKNLPEICHFYPPIVARNEATFKCTIPAEWQNSDATKRYVNDLDYYSSLWHCTRVCHSVHPVLTRASPLASNQCREDRTRTHRRSALRPI